jgi:hypothetical protein
MKGRIRTHSAPNKQAHETTTCKVSLLAASAFVKLRRAAPQGLVVSRRVMRAAMYRVHTCKGLKYFYAPYG